MENNPLRFSPLSKALLVIFAALLVFARFYHADVRSFFLDELYSVVAALEPGFSRFMEDWVYYDNSPPLYYLALRGWLQLVPATEFWVRSLSGIAGVLALITFILGVKKRFPGVEWFYLLLLSGCSYGFLFFSHDARSYSFLLLFTCLQLLYFMDLLGQKTTGSDKRTLLKFCVCTILSAYTHYSGALFGSMLFIGLLIGGAGDRSFVKRIVLAALACLLTGIPWLPYFWFNMHLDKLVIDHDGLSIIKLLVPMIFFGTTLTGKCITVFVCIFIAFVAYMSRTFFAKAPGTYKAVFFLALLSSAVIALSSYITPMRTYRHYIVFIPVILLALAFLLSLSGMVLNKSLLLLAGIGMVAVETFSLHQAPREEWRQTVEYILDAKGAVPAKVIVLGEPWEKSAKEYLLSHGEPTNLCIRRKAFYQYYFDRMAGPNAIYPVVLRPVQQSVEDYIRQELEIQKQVFVLGYKGDLMPGIDSLHFNSSFIRVNKRLFFGHVVFHISRIEQQKKI